MQKDARLVDAVHLATRKLAISQDFDQVLLDVLQICCDAVGASGGTVYIHDPVEQRLRFRHVLPKEVAEKLPFKDISDKEGVAGKVFQSRRIEVSVFDTPDEGTRGKIAEATGIVVRTMVTVPLVLADEDPIGIVQLINKKDGPFDETDVSVLDTVAAVSTMAFINSKLMASQARASSLLGMGKVSHDIGNLAASLYAQILYSEDALNRIESFIRDTKPSEDLEHDVHTIGEMYREMRASVDRIVGYSRLVSDLSAGRKLRPNFVCEPMGPTVLNSAAFLQTEGRNSFVELIIEIDDTAPATLHDQLYLFRIVQNLVGNSIKAVRETIPDSADLQEGETYGKVTVRYSFEDGDHVLAVSDTGPGMPPETVQRILAGEATSTWGKASGSGWGTRIVLELAQTHNGQVSIESEPGSGTTFKVRFPHAETLSDVQPFVK
ncbi:MAG: sensor histidine kinase [Fimbriimonadaceae bacterium]